MGWADALGGLGAGLQGNLPAWQVAQTDRLKTLGDLDEQRRQALLLDFRGTLLDLKSGNLSSAASRLQSRLGAIEKLGGDPSHTAELAGMIQDGRIDEAVAGLQELDDRAVLSGALPSMAPKYENMKQLADGSWAGINSISGKQERIPAEEGLQFAQSQGAAAGNPKMGMSRVFKDSRGNMFFGSNIFDPASGKQRGDLVSISGDPAIRPEGEIMLVDSYGLNPMERVSQKGEESRAASEGAATGSGNVGRLQGFVDEGTQAAKGIPVLKRALSLLETVETGGIDAVRLNAKQWFGIESANEAELTANLGKAVLSQLRATFGAAFTAKEGEKLEVIEANFGKSTAGNKRLINQLLKMSTKYANIGITAANKVDDPYAAETIKELMNFTLDDSDYDEPAPAAPGTQSAPVVPGSIDSGRPTVPARVVDWSEL